MWKYLRIVLRFFTDLAYAAYFAAIEYDVKLQETKTTSDRILIWFAVILITVCILAAILYMFWTLLDSIDIKPI